MTPDAAETLALEALAWIVADEQLLPRFAAATGAGLTDMRTRAQDAEFLTGVLEFLVTEDRWVAAFCDARGVPYDRPMRALMALSGGRHGEWA